MFTYDGTFLPTTDQRCTAPYMVKGGGSKPKAGGSDALAKSLNVAKYTRLKPGELQHEMDIRRKFTVHGPGPLPQSFCHKLVVTTCFTVMSDGACFLIKRQTHVQTSYLNCHKSP